MRRSAVETEIESLGKLSEYELEIRYQVLKTENGYVSMIGAMPSKTSTVSGKGYEEVLRKLTFPLRATFVNLEFVNRVIGTQTDLRVNSK